MSNKSVLEQAASYFKNHHPGMTPEAVVCFLILLDLKNPSVGDIAKAVRMNEPVVYQHLSLLTSGGAGLVHLVNAGDGRNMVQLTDIGQMAKSHIQTALA